MPYICNGFMALSFAETARSRSGSIEPAPPRWMRSCVHPMKLIYHVVIYCQGHYEGSFGSRVFLEMGRKEPGAQHHKLRRRYSVDQSNFSFRSSLITGF